MTRTPTLTYGDSYTVGQLAHAWEKSSEFVRRMIIDGKLRLADNGLITNDALREFYASHGTELD
jgi:hypothetical protein